jgi:hypothetical protein
MVYGTETALWRNVMRERWLFVGMLAACALRLVTPALVAAQINIGINIGTPPPPPSPVVITTPPRLVVIPGTQVFYAPSVPQNYFVYGGKSYIFQDGTWLVAPTHHGPWTLLAVEHVPPPLRGVPVRYYKVPHGHRKEKGPPPWTGHGKGHKHHKHDD